VASDIPGYREVVTGETTVSVPPDDPRALADAIAMLVGDEPRRAAMGAASRELAVGRYGWPDLARRLYGIYEGVVARNARVAA
jgi:glycosyltransferase involved in cell wall biosynthesis